MEVIVESLLAGQIAPLGPRGAPSGIDKKPVSGPVRLLREGLECDAQGDRKVHGGPEKAVHHYPHDHYATWVDDVGKNPRLEMPGAFGENISTTGLTEHNVAVGDRFRLGSALVEVSQGRQPCWKLNARFDITDMAIRVQKSGRSGWYYRVVEEGIVSEGDTMRLVERLSPEWTLHRVWHLLYVDMLNYEELALMAQIPHLADGWKRYAVRRLENRKVEDWSARLQGNQA
ncbi:MOSC domain-containing protein [Brucella pseudogrignonensis]|uniref:MOSC domain protein n=1 Tax=Brucella pseudogrignonensis TaxID=419475 RepID=A0A256GNY2_9HYPH|nr:MOSC domain-containing protein [Brucella pseudogrignonensis]EMG53701.1 MOSC domain-containing protein [Ochrobactrum sp. CDB2]MCM0750527.1 MOSC domain-containing protein [Brucella pseudogrignonensis]NNV21830.1 MOSC domain-containing protein [Brucella pseudogrignonensis]OYR28884.1 MOSC domain protein [Brucella pseudogrignonensis]